MAQLNPTESETVYALVKAARTLSPSNPVLPYNNIGEIWVRRCEEAPEANWLTFIEDDGGIQQFSNTEFFSQIRQAAGALQGSLGLRPGDRIATLLNNDPRTVLIYNAAWVAGMTVVPINLGEDDERVSFILANSEAKALFGFPEQLTRVSQFAELDLSKLQLVSVGQTNDASSHSFEELISGCAPVNSLPDVSSESECLIVYTSGTTGAPKGVVLEQSNLICDAETIAKWHQFGPSDRAMCVLPIHHVNGIVVTICTSLLSGGSLVLNRRLRAGAFWKTLADENCTWVSVVPTVLAYLCEKPDDLSMLDLARFRHIICGAGPLTTDLAARFDRTFGVRVVHGYGLSETTCYSTFLPTDLVPGEYAYWMFECGYPSIGCPVDANEMAIHDAHGGALPAEARGEIVIKGPNVMRGYFKRPEANADTFKHGWFRSGDEGFFRKGTDGRDYYFITGRIKELIIRGGVNYSPFDIDEVLNSIPGVKAGMAVGFENNFYGEEVGAYVQLEEGASVTAEQILASCRSQLPYSKSPKVVLFGDSFPVTSTGKYQRNKLKPLFTEWKDTQFREEKKRS